MKNTKTVKKAQHDKYNLGVYNGVKITLKIPSRWYTAADKDNKYFLESYYNQKQKQHKEDVRDMFNDYIQSLGNKKLTSAEKLEGLKELFYIYIQQIITSLNLPTETTKLTLNTNVIAAVNAYLDYQITLHDNGRLEKLYDYKNRNKELNLFFNKAENKYLSLRNLSVDIWEKYRIYLAGTKKQNSTINQHITYVKSFYNWLIKQKEIIIHNHPVVLDKLDTSKQIEKYAVLSNETLTDVFPLLNSDKYLKLHIICLLTLENTVRPVQVREVQHKYINLPKNEITVYDRKSKKWRTIIITDTAKALIQKIYDNNAKVNKPVNDDDYLIGGYNRFKSGKPSSRKDIADYQLKPFREAYPQFDDVQIYEMKHTSITKESKEGNISTASSRAGHNSLQVTTIYDRGIKKTSAISLSELLEIED